VKLTAIIYENNGRDNERNRFWVTIFPESSKHSPILAKKRKTTLFGVIPPHQFFPQARSIRHEQPTSWPFPSRSTTGRSEKFVWSRGNTPFSIG